MELKPVKLDEETIVFGVEYENGSEPIFMIRSVMQTSLFRKKPMIAIIAGSLNEDMSVRKVYLRTFMRAPTNPDDIEFMIELANHIKSTAWAIADIEEIGDCVTYPRRKQF
jgi:hypothetical protein